MRLANEVVYRAGAARDADQLADDPTVENVVRQMLAFGVKVAHGVRADAAVEHRCGGQVAGLAGRGHAFPLNGRTRPAASPIVK